MLRSAPEDHLEPKAPESEEEDPDEIVLKNLTILLFNAKLTFKHHNANKSI